MTAIRNKRSYRMLIVEDSIDQLNRCTALALEIMDVQIAMTPEDAKQLLQSQRFDLVLLDIHLSSNLGQMNFEGLDILTFIRSTCPESLVVAMSSDPKIETYERSMKLGADQFIKKPILNVDELKIAIEGARERRRLNQAKDQQRRPGLAVTFPETCRDGVVLDGQIRKYVESIARARTIPTVIYGETGTGKEEVAKLIYKRRREADGPIPFVAVNCANLTTDLAASILFGHAKGAFTGADKATNGLIGEADGGILFLDEIHHLSPDCQRRLLRVLNDGQYERLGDVKGLYSDFQVIVASTRDLDEMVEEGKFLLDLRSRLLGVDIHLKPLRERFDDISSLVLLFFIKEGWNVPAEEMAKIVDRCKQFYWQGNIRQLFMVLKSFVTMAHLNEEPLLAVNLPIFKTMQSPALLRHSVSGQIPADMQEQVLKPLIHDMPMKDAVENYEKLILQRAFGRYEKIQSVAHALDMSRGNIDAKRRKYGLA